MHDPTDNIKLRLGNNFVNEEGNLELDSSYIGVSNDYQMSVDLLDMLAEVASNSPQQDPSSSSSSKNHLKGCKIIAKRTNQLLRLFSKFDGDEMRRKFTFTCMFNTGECEMIFSSFGSELKARQNMKSHLIEHVQQAGGIQCAFNKQRKLRITRKSKGSKCNAQKSHPDYISSPSTKRLDKSFQLLPIKSCQKSHNQNNARKIAQCDFKHFCGKAKCDKQTKTATHPSVCMVFDEHNYTTLKKSSTSISNLVELQNRNIVEILDSYGNDTNKSLNSFMVQEVNSEKVIATCSEMKHSQLIYLPPVGREVAVSTSLMETHAGESCGKDFLKKVENSDDPTRILSPETKSDHFAASSDDLSETAVQNQQNVDKKLSDKELAIQLIAEAKFKGSAHILHCTICSPQRKFTALTTLISHYRSHAGIKPFECGICRRLFTRAHSLKYHLLIHQNATRFTCTHCARKFRHPSHFREHLRKHTGEEPFQCADCAARFKTRNTFKRHLKSRHSKLLSASGQVIQLTEDADESVLQSRLPTSDEQETSTAGFCALANEHAGDKTTLDWDLTIDRASERQAYFSLETSRMPASWDCMGLCRDADREKINCDSNSSAHTFLEHSNDSNNNASNQSAFLAISNKIPRSSN